MPVCKGCGDEADELLRHPGPRSQVGLRHATALSKKPE